jgi:hypothetical protein
VRFSFEVIDGVSLAKGHTLSSVSANGTSACWIVLGIKKNNVTIAREDYTQKHHIGIYIIEMVGR